jgi:hypothetical protein
VAGSTAPQRAHRSQTLDVGEHQFLAATDNLDYSFERIKGAQNTLGGSGTFMDKFRACPAVFKVNGKEHKTPVLSTLRRNTPRC